MTFEREQLSKIPIWVQFSNIPLKFWNEEGLSHIASAVGIPLYANSLTEDGKRLSYARICVEVTVDSVLRDHVNVLYSNGNSATINVHYPWKPLSCTKCLIFGHSDSQCKNGVAHTACPDAMPVTGCSDVPVAGGPLGILAEYRTWLL